MYKSLRAASCGLAAACVVNFLVGFQSLWLFAAAVALRFLAEDLEMLKKERDGN